MEVDSVVLGDMEFRGVEFFLKLELEEEMLVVEIMDSVTADQWRGEFDPAYIEDLTRKTGNFKQFPIFCSMLESAVNKTSEAVALDLLTYADLELLRNRKAGVVGRPRLQPQSPALSAKRYLILIYTVEFDRIHYPLPLPYQGKPDPAALQREIRVLRAELCAMRTQGGAKNSAPETRKLHAELALLKAEKEALTKALERVQGGAGGAAPGMGPRELRGVVQGLEEQLLRERAKSQRSASKRGLEQRLMLEQLEELKASERALRIRVKSLTNELAALRRGRTTPLHSGRSSSRGEGEIQRPASRERSLGSRGVRARSGSRERMENRARRAESSGACPRIPRPSPSPTGSCGPRFDPTAYIHERQRRQRETNLKNQRNARRGMLPLAPEQRRGRSRSRETRPQLGRAGSTDRARSLSRESQRSCRSSNSSLAEFEELARPRPSRDRKAAWKIQALPRGQYRSQKPLCSTPTTRRAQGANKVAGSLTDTGADLSEIDARLQALQEYMRDLDTGR